MDESTPFLERTELTAKTMWTDFKNFINQGNVVDLAVGIVVGGAFGAVVTSFVSDLFIPVVSLIVSSELSETFVVLKKGPNFPYTTRAEAVQDGAVTWNYGNFVQLFINFLLMSVALFIVIKMFSTLKRKNKASAAPTTKDCPMCYKDIDIRAAKCPFCTADLMGSSGVIQNL